MLVYDPVYAILLDLFCSGKCMLVHSTRIFISMFYPRTKCDAILQIHIFCMFSACKTIFVDHVPHHYPLGKSPISLVKSPFSLGKSPISRVKSPFSLGKSPSSLAKSPFSTENAHLALQQFQGSTASGATMSHLEAMANDKFIGFPWGANKKC